MSAEQDTVDAALKLMMMLVVVVMMFTVKLWLLVLLFIQWAVAL